MKYRPHGLQWAGLAEIHMRIVGERTHDGEHQKVRLFVKVAKDAPEVEVPMPSIPEWVHETLVDVYEREVA